MLEDIERLFEPKNKTIRDIKGEIMILNFYLERYPKDLEESMKGS